MSTCHHCGNVPHNETYSGEFCTIDCAMAYTRARPTILVAVPVTDQRLIDRIPTHQDTSGNGLVYWEPEIRTAATTVIDLLGGLLAVDHADDLHVSVALFAFSSGPAYLGDVEVEPRACKRIMHGDGPSGPLRELRHTFWGDQNNGGYVFYPSAALICGAFEALKRWFDCE